MQDDEMARAFEDLQDRVLALGNLVEGMLIRPAELLQRPDAEGLEWLGKEGRHARLLRLGIEIRCLALSAAQEPVIWSKRSTVVLTERASEPELVGEHARQVGRADQGLLEGHFTGSLQSIHQAGALREPARPGN